MMFILILVTDRDYGSPRIFDTMSRASIADSCDVLPMHRTALASGSMANGNARSPDSAQIEQQRRLSEMRSLLAEIKKEQQKLQKVRKAR